MAVTESKTKDFSQAQIQTNVCVRFSFRGSRPCSRFYEKHADMPCQGAQYCIQGCFQHSGTPGLLRYIDSLTILSSRARAARLSNTRISALSKLLFQVGAFPNSMGLKAQSFRAGVRGWRFLSFKGCTRGFGSVAPGFQKSKPNSPF